VASAIIVSQFATTLVTSHSPGYYMNVIVLLGEACMSIRM